jgi:heme exporter protein B
LPVFTLLFNVPLLNWQIIVTTLLATLGFVIVGTLFAALAVNTRTREMVLPVLFLPVIVPVIIAAVQSSTRALSGARWAELVPWLPLIAAYDIIFLVVAVLTFAFVIEE